MMLDIFASSDYRPPIAYAPVHLDCPHQHDPETDGPCELENLYYIRFPGNTLPSYYFWTRRRDWQDPLKMNPKWKGEKLLDEEAEGAEREAAEAALEQDRKAFYVRAPNDKDKHRPYPVNKSKTRVKKPNLPRDILEPPMRPPKTPKYDAAVGRIERQLVLHGFDTTLRSYRKHWLDNGKEQHYFLLVENMPKLYPSAKLPETPPVHQNQRRLPRSLAEKMASVQAPSRDRPLSPIRGDEPWTRDDDKYWDVADVPPKISEDDIQEQLLKSQNELLRGSRDSTDLGRRTRNILTISERRTRRGDMDNDARRRSSASAIGKRKRTEMDSWLDDLEENYEPPPARSPQPYPLKTPVLDMTFSPDGSPWNAAKARQHGLSARQAERVYWDKAFVEAIRDQIDEVEGKKRRASHNDARMWGRAHDMGPVVRFGILNGKFWSSDEEEEEEEEEEDEEWYGQEEVGEDGNEGQAASGFNAARFWQDLLGKKVGHEGEKQKGQEEEGPAEAEGEEDDEEAEEGEWEEVISAPGDDEVHETTPPPENRPAREVINGSQHRYRTWLPEALDDMPIEELKDQIQTLLDGDLEREEVCRLCFKIFSNKAVNVRSHYEAHLKELDDRCPFCDRHWFGLNSEVSIISLRTFCQPWLLQQGWNGLH
jgi:hypothetical protein